MAQNGHKYKTDFATISAQPLWHWSPFVYHVLQVSRVSEEREQQRLPHQ